jgi:cobalamin biosynthesis protein CbiD
MDTKPAIIDAITHAEIVQNLSEKLRAYYVFPDIAEQICIRLQEYLQRGEYAAITEGELLASALTAQLQEVNQDRHFIL